MPFRILIVDDDVTIRRLLRRILEERPGWEVRRSSQWQRRHCPD